MRLIDADALAEEIEKNMENGFPANEYLSLYAISCIAHAPTVDVFDKIKAEIEQNAYPIVHGFNNHEKGMTLYGILQIIDKYKAEMESEE